MNSWIYVSTCHLVCERLSVMLLASWTWVENLVQKSQFTTILGFGSQNTPSPPPENWNLSRSWHFKTFQFWLLENNPPPPGKLKFKHILGILRLFMFWLLENKTPPPPPRDLKFKFLRSCHFRDFSVLTSREYPHPPPPPPTDLGILRLFSFDFKEKYPPPPRRDLNFGKSCHFNDYSVLTCPEYHSSCKFSPRRYVETRYLYPRGYRLVSAVLNENYPEESFTLLSPTESVAKSQKFLESGNLILFYYAFRKHFSRLTSRSFREWKKN